MASNFPGLTPQQLTDFGGLAAAFAAGAVGYLRKKPPETDPKKAVEAQTVAMAMAAPLGDPNQLRQVVDAINRLCDFAEHALKIMDDIKDEGERTNAALGRNEESNRSVASALRDLDEGLRRRR